MIDPSPPAAVETAADPTVPGRSLTFERRWAASTSEQLERTRLLEQARDTDAAASCGAASRARHACSTTSAGGR